MKHLFSLALILLILSSCGGMFEKRVRGNGNVSSDTRSTGSFDRVETSGAIDVYVRQDSSTSVRIETDGNLLELVDVHADGNVLHIHERDGYNLRSTRGIKVYVSSPTYNGFDASGASSFVGETPINSSQRINIDLSGASSAKLELNAPDVVADLSGACSVDLRGKTKNVDLEGSGASEFKCGDLLAENVDVSISGAGEADVYASVKLDASVSGAGSIRYKGNPTVNQRTSGAGSVKKVD